MRQSDFAHGLQSGNVKQAMGSDAVVGGKVKNFFSNVLAPGFKSIFGKGAASAQGPTQSDLYSGPGANWGDVSSYVHTGGPPSIGSSIPVGGSSGSGTPQVAGSAGFNQANNGQVSFDRIVNFATLDPARRGYPVIGGEGSKPNATGGTINQPQETPGYVPAGALVQGDAYGNAAAHQALGTLGQISQTGWSPTDQASFAAAQRQSNLAEQSQREAVLRNAQARGQSSGGLGFAGALAAQQQNANTTASTGASIAQQGADRRLQANAAMGALGASLNDQQFNQEQARAQSIDQFNQWAAGKQADAAQQAYENNRQHWQDENARGDRQWSRATGGFGALRSLGGSD